MVLQQSGEPFQDKHAVERVRLAQRRTLRRRPSTVGRVRLAVDTCNDRVLRSAGVGGTRLGARSGGRRGGSQRPLRRSAAKATAISHALWPAHPRLM